MSRKKKFLLNTVMGVIKQIITVICGFILPRYMLLYYGSSVNGLISSITNFLGFISLLDMGVGAVVQANLYKPLAEVDKTHISMVLKSSERFFRRLAYIFIVYIIVLCFAFPSMVDFGWWYTVSLLLIISVSTLAQYLFGMTYQLLLNADQKSYIPLLMQTGTIVLNTVFAILLMREGASVHMVKMMTAIVYLLRPLGQMYYVRKKYDIDKKIKIKGEPIKQKWNGFSQHLAAVICQNIDVTVLTIFSTLQNVSVYSVYYNVTSGVEQIVMMASTGLEALFGNMIAKQERESLLNVFGIIEWILHTSVAIIFSITAITIVPFVSIYTRGIKDANYITPVFALLLVSAYAAECLRIPYFRVVKAAGHFKETQNGAFIAAVLNILVTVALVFKYGLIGTGIGTLFAMFYHTIYFVWYLRKNILNRSITIFLKYMIVDIAIAVISYIISQGLGMKDLSYIGWIFYVLKVSIIVLSISFILNTIVFKTQIKKTFDYLKRKC